MAFNIYFDNAFIIPTQESLKSSAPQSDQVKKSPSPSKYILPPIEHINGPGLTPLMVSCKDNNVKAVKSLLEAGADPNIISINGDTALLLSGHPEIIQTLIRYGADVSRKDKQENTIAHIHADNFDIIKILLYELTLLGQRHILDEYNNQGKTVLQLAIEAGNYNIAEELIWAGVKITSNEWLSLLPNAPKDFILKLAKVSLDIYFHVIICFLKRSIPTLSYIQIFYEYGAPIDCKLLIECISYHDTEASLWLIDILHGADQNIDQEALYYACLEGRAEVIQSLLKKGVEFKAPEYIDLICSSNSTDALTIIYEEGIQIDVGRCIQISVETNSKDIIHMVCSISPQRDIQQALINVNQYDNTLLMRACALGRLDIVEYFVSDFIRSIVFIDLNLENKCGKKCIDIAYLNGHTNIIKCLIKAGADFKHDRELFLYVMGLSELWA